jgi:hypothetical protein
MINSKDRLFAFCRLGKLLNATYDINNQYNTLEYSVEETLAIEGLSKAKFNCLQHNAWFTAQSVSQAIKGISAILDENTLSKWFEQYNIPDQSTFRKVGVVMAGNIPAVGFHDFLCVLITGHIFVGKLSDADRFLLPAIARILVAIDSRFDSYIHFTTERLTGFDSVIATGSANTSRYFEYYFGKYPHIIRSNRNSIAVLNGKETKEELQLLGSDIFSYFGLGCRNVSMIFVPVNYNFENLLEVLTDKTELISHSKYFNNYEYNKAIMLINSVNHYDNGIVLLKEEDSMNSPVSVLHYHYYNAEIEVKNWIETNSEKIQCIVSGNKNILKSIPFGKSQLPEVSDYADGIDTMKFLLEL